MAIHARPSLGALLAASLALGPISVRAWAPGDARPLIDPSIMCVAQGVVAHAPTPTWTDAQLVLGAREAWASGRLDDARAMLDEAARRFPRIADHVSVMLGEIELEAGDPAAARTRFEAALEGTSPSLRLEARIGRVRALLELGQREGESALDDLLAEYPELPDAERLAFARGLAAERRDQNDDAVAAYRALDLEYPGSVFAEEARSHLATLLAAGIEVRPYSLEERIDRAARLVSTGPMQPARETVDALLAEQDLSSGQRRTLLRLAIRVARVEGRFADVSSLEVAMRAVGRKNTAIAATVDESDEDSDEHELLEAAPSEATPDEAAQAAQTEAADEADGRTHRARAEVARILHGRSLARLPVDLVDDVADVAAGGALDDTLRAAVERARDDGTPAETRFAVAMAASARPGFEEAALSLLSGLGEASGDLATAARYHRARLLERLGRLDEARTLFESVIAADRSSGRYYTLWTTQRLAAVAEAIAARDAEVARSGAQAALPDGGMGEVVTADAGAAMSTSFDDRGSRTFDLQAESVELPLTVDLDALAGELDAVAGDVAETYPWVGRAADLLRVRAIEEARSELFEALVSHRLSTGRGVHRYGLEAVSRGVSRATRTTGRRGHATARPTRRPLEESTRAVLADVAAALGDHGTAIAFGGAHSADARPRAFAVEVVSAARQFGVDPNLLWAVMRVESVYQPRIVSYAGAIGLMQIMPRTGRLIAQRLGRTDFTTAKLLDPATNLEFAAWYLRSLIDRFDGDVPLAVAAYNGGPHNVRVWLDRMGPTVPLDAFLERIPFDQTHRYVRRVLTHYAAYRARDGLPMIDLDLAPPRSRPDSVAF